MGSRTGAAALAVLLTVSCAMPRRAALAEFESTLAAQDSATAALTQWCAVRGLADPARISAAQVPGLAALPAGLHRRLDIAPGAVPGYRHVRLSCGGRVLSDAHNWYVPQRLTPAMNEVLRTTDTPFGKVAAPLGFRRERLDSQRGRAQGCPKGTILSHRALLRLADGQPLALVVECYTSTNLARTPTR